MNYSKSPISKEYLEEHYIRLEKPTTEICKELGCSAEKVASFCKKYGIKLRGPHKDFIGVKFDSWVVISQAAVKEYPSNRKKFLWKCECRDCGREKVFTSVYISQYKTKKYCTCPKNLRPKRKQPGSGSKPKPVLYISNIPQFIWKRIIDGAKTRNLELGITPEYIWLLFLKQRGKCALSGELLTFPITNKDLYAGKTTASLDRIDSTKGYIDGNVQWVFKDLNLIKSSYNEEYFIGLCKKVAFYQTSIGN